MEHSGAHVRLAVGDDIQPLVIYRVEHCALLHVAVNGGVVVGQNVNLAYAIYSIVLADGLSALVVTCDISAHNHTNAHLAVTTKRIHAILYIIDREVVITLVVEIFGNALALLVQNCNVENITHLDERLRRVGLYHGGYLPVAEVIREALYAVWLTLLGAVCDVGALAAARGVDVILYRRRVVATRVHICLEILRTLVRQREVEQYGLLANLALEIVPPIILCGVCKIICPDVEICPQKSFVGCLAYVLLKCGGIYALRLGCAVVSLDVYTLQKVFALGEFARDATRRA